MTKLYGFGNALVDIEVNVSEEILNEIGIEKGSMIHIDNKQKKDLLKTFHSKISKKFPGGSIANVLHAASSNCSKGCYSCSLGADDNKKIFLKGFNSNKIQTFAKVSNSPTGVCLVFITPDGERTMASNLAANKDLHPSCLNESALISSDWLIFDAFSICTPGGFATTKKALNLANKNNLKVCFGLADINLVESNKSEILWVLSQSIDLIAGNENEISLLKDYIPINTNVLCSLGSKGCRFNSIQTKVNSNVNIVNTNGAGDALLGIFLSYIDNLTTEKALRKAVDYATQVCQVGGPRI